MLNHDDVNWERPWWMRICRKCSAERLKRDEHNSLSSLQGQNCTVVALRYRGDRWLKQPGQKMEGNHKSLSKASAGHRIFQARGRGSRTTKERLGVLNE
jgi:hypothetical protein